MSFSHSANNHAANNHAAKLLTVALVLSCMFGLTASASSGPEAEPVPGNPMAFDFTTGTDSEGHPHLWNFGDGNTSTEQAPSHTYDYPGRYVVTVTVMVKGLEQTHDVGVVEAGHVALFQDFETSPPAGWSYDPSALSSTDVISGSKDWVVNIISPAVDDSCVPPSHVPKDPPSKTHPMLDTSVYEGLVDLRSAVLAEGSELSFFWLNDPDSDGPVAEARVRRYQGQTQIGLVMADSRGIYSQWTTLSSLLFRAEIQPWKATLETPESGGGRLRVLDAQTSVETALLELSGLTNADAVWTSPVFGISRSSFPDGSSGKMRLDDLAVRTYRCIPPAALDLLGYWSFDDPQNLGHDGSNYARHGTPVGGATGNGEALHLDGTGYLSIPSLGTSLTDQKRLTVEAWVRVENHSQMNIFRSRQPLSLHSDRFGVSNYVDGSGWENVTANPLPPLDEPYHLAGVFNGGKLQIYVNGELQGEEIVPFTEAQGTWYTDWAIGARIPGGSSTADQFFAGSIDELKLYARALSASEIRAASRACHP